MLCFFFGFMKITLIGSGYVGLVTGACLAETGNTVICVDINQTKIDLLNQGIVPIYEPGLEELIKRNRHAGRLSFSTDIKAGVQHGEILFIAVGTPSDEDGSADLQYVLSAARMIGQSMEGFVVVVNKSTVPVGTAEKVHQVITEELIKRGFSAEAAVRRAQQQPDFAVVSNPEFLKEGAAVEDFMRPDRIVIGVDDSPAGNVAKTQMRQLYAPFTRNHERTLVMDVKAAEFTKYAANAMLATRISFMNELANLADKVGVDIEQVRQGIGSDPRIGYHFLYPGVGYGGSCFPKDVRALQRTAQEYGQSLHVMEAVEAVNQAQKYKLVEKIIARFGENLSGYCFALWGLAFKPNTDDMREAPSRLIVQELIKRGASIRAYDPVAMDEAQRCFKLDFAHNPDLLSQLVCVSSFDEALHGASALVIATEWKAFRSPDWTTVKSALKHAVIFDGRNLYDPRVLADMEIEYHGIGRSNAVYLD